MARMRGAAGRAATAAAAGPVRATAPSAAACRSVRKRAAVIAPTGHRALGGAPEGFAWVQVLGEARANARPLARFSVLMMIAGVIASLGVIDDNPILIVGAMAVSPDLLPICATCVGIVGRRRPSIRQALA